MKYNEQHSILFLLALSLVFTDSFTNSTESPAGSDEESYSPNEAFIDPSERANFYDNTNNGDKTEDHGQLV